MDLDEMLIEGQRLWEARKYGEAASQLRALIEWVEKAHGPNAEEMIEPLFWLSGSVAPPGKIGANGRAEAVEILQRALRIAEAVWGRTDRRLARLSSTLAEQLRGLERNEEARDHLRHALDTLESAGASDDRVAPLLTSLVDVLLDLEQPAQALPLARRAVRINEQSQGRLAHVGLGYACYALGRCCLGVNDKEEATANFERSLECFARNRGEHPNALEKEIHEILESMGHVGRGDSPPRGSGGALS